VPLDIPVLLDRLCYRYPSLLVDSVVEHLPGRRIVAVKNVTVNEDYFQGHFPGMPLMPGVMMIETLAQVATLLLLDEAGPPTRRAVLRGVNDAKFRRQVVPGDRLRLEVTRERERQGLAVARGVATVADRTVAEAELLLGIEYGEPDIHPTAVVHPAAFVGAGTVVGPYAVIGPEVRLGCGNRIGSSAVIEGDTEIGDDCHVLPFASVGQIPQDLKFRGEATRLRIGHRNVFREFVTIHRGTRGGGGLTRIGDDNVFMAYAHVAHDCLIGNKTLFGNGATLGGHVVVEDGATISAGSGVHQFCHVGRQAFIGGYTVVTKDALPYAKTVGNRARVYGLNRIGLERRGESPQTIAKLKRAFRYLLQSKLNTSQALEQIDSDPNLDCPEVAYLVEFIRESRRGSRRGVTLRRPLGRGEPLESENRV
jgi:UDP-N-acetylglucosamine acyltransferase